MGAYFQRELNAGQMLRLVYGVASCINVLPPCCRTSSSPASARLIHSVTRSSGSSPGRDDDSATTALTVRSAEPHEGRTVAAVWRNFSASEFACSSDVSG